MQYTAYVCSCTTSFHPCDFVRHFPVRHFPVLHIPVLQIQLSRDQHRTAAVVTSARPLLLSSQQPRRYYRWNDHGTTDHFWTWSVEFHSITPKVNGVRKIHVNTERTRVKHYSLPCAVCPQKIKTTNFRSIGLIKFCKIWTIYAYVHSGHNIGCIVYWTCVALSPYVRRNYNDVISKLSYLQLETPDFIPPTVTAEFAGFGSCRLLCMCGVRQNCACVACGWPVLQKCNRDC